MSVPSRVRVVPTMRRKRSVKSTSRPTSIPASSATAASVQEAGRMTSRRLHHLCHRDSAHALIASPSSSTSTGRSVITGRVGATSWPRSPRSALSRGPCQAREMTGEAQRFGWSYPGDELEDDLDGHFGACPPARMHHNGTDTVSAPPPERNQLAVESQGSNGPPCLAGKIPCC